ncbi:hypothetical protein FWH30_03030 [Microgenomates group bacterium]|nr:hypothetical protein [Microgenomates group bacterium]
MPRAKARTKTKTNFSTKLSSRLGGTPKEVEDTKALFVTKGVLLLIMSIGLYVFGQANASYLWFFVAGFLVVNGLIMIASNLVNEHAALSYRLMAVLVGGLSIFLGSASLLYLNVATALVYVLILGICLDAFFTISSILWLTSFAENKWWAATSGVIGIVTLAALFGSEVGNWPLLLGIYGALQGLFYCSTMFLFAVPKKGRRG